jgi:hypothetical protein
MKKIEDFIQEIHNLPEELVKTLKIIEKQLEEIDSDDAERILGVLLANTIEREYKENGEKIVEAANNKNKILFNQWGQYKWDGGDHSGYVMEGLNIKEFTMEPYYIWKENIKKLIEWADKEGLDFYIDGKSPHFPGRTVIIHLIKTAC